MAPIGLIMITYCSYHSCVKPNRLNWKVCEFQILFSLFWFPAKQWIHRTKMKFCWRLNGGLVPAQLGSEQLSGLWNHIIFGSEARSCFSSSLGPSQISHREWPRHLTSVFTVLFVSSDLGISRDFSLTAHRHSTGNIRARKTLSLTLKSQGTLSEVVTLHRWQCSGVASLEELPSPHSGAKLHSALLFVWAHSSN